MLARGLSFVLVALFAHLGPDAVFADSSCLRGPSADRIHACTLLLEKTLEPEVRAKLFRNRAQAYSLERKFESADNDYEAALAILPGDFGILRGRVSDYLRAHRYFLALNYANEMLRPDEKRNKHTHHLRCDALKGLGRLQEAISACTTAIRIKPFYPNFVQRGQVYLAAGMPEKALKDFNIVLKTDRRFAWALLGKGEALFALQRYKESLSAFNDANRAASAAGSPWPLALSKRGLANEALGLRAQAVSDFRRALVLLEDYTQRAPPLPNPTIASINEVRDGLKRLGAEATPPAKRPWWRLW